MNINNYKQPLISIIIPVYKVEQYLEKCVESVRNQDYPNLEILLIDDGSPDACPKICDEYEEKDRRIKVIHKKNGGLASARNVGLDNARGEYIAFVDSDDWLAPQAYSTMMKLLLDQGLDIVCCEISRMCGEKEIERYRFFETGTVLSGKDVTKEILLDKIGSQVVKAIYHAHCWKNLRFPIGRLYEDIPVTFLAFSKARQVGFIAEPFYLYRSNDESISLSPQPLKPYHEFLGFKEHYDYSCINYPEIENECLANTAIYAISTCFHYYSERNKLLKEACIETQNFLLQHKGQIMEYSGFMKSRAIALHVFYFSRRFFRISCRIFHITGLQKALHFDKK